MHDRSCCWAICHYSPRRVNLLAMASSFFLFSPRRVDVLAEASSCLLWRVGRRAKPAPCLYSTFPCLFSWFSFGLVHVGICFLLIIFSCLRPLCVGNHFFSYLYVLSCWNMLIISINNSSSLLT